MNARNVKNTRIAPGALLDSAVADELRAIAHAWLLAEGITSFDEIGGCVVIHRGVADCWRSVAPPIDVQHHRPNTVAVSERGEIWIAIGYGWSESASHWRLVAPDAVPDTRTTTGVAA